jgi:hypothetical protein
VRAVRYLGAGSRITVDVKGAEVAAILPSTLPAPAIGSIVGLSFDTAAMHVMEGEG